MIRFLKWIRRVCIAVYTTTWAFALVLSVVTSLAFGIVTVSSTLVFNVMAGIAESVHSSFGSKSAENSIRHRHRVQLERFDFELADSKSEVAKLTRERNEIALRNRDLAGRVDNLEGGSRQLRDSIFDLVSENSELTEINRVLRADQFVTYRGQHLLVSEAVSDTSKRVSSRVSVATARNLASMPGEAIPVWGAAVVVAATTWEIHDACQMMKDMQALNATFNPSDIIDDSQVCGQEVPTAAELWEEVRNSPSAIASMMKGTYHGLPKFEPRSWANSTGLYLSSSWDRILGFF